MSFSLEAKKEMCRQKPEFKSHKPESKSLQKAIAQCYGMLLFSKKFSSEKIIFSSGSEQAVKLLFELITQLFSPIILEKRFYVKNKKAEKNQYILQLPNPADCKRVFEFFGHSDRDLTLRINRSNLESEEEICDFLRGAFLAVGTVTDPEKNYHLDFSVQYKTLCLDLSKLMTEIEVLQGQPPKCTERNGVFVCYVKGSEQITDILVYLGAQNAAMNIMSEKAIKQIRNQVNRKTNSEIANIKKSAKASARQISAIKKLKKSGKLQTLPPELLEVAKIRLENPEMSLRDLGRALVPAVSRSGVNHRLERIIKIAGEEE